MLQPVQWLIYFSVLLLCFHAIVMANKDEYNPALPFDRIQRQITREQDTLTVFAPVTLTLTQCLQTL